MEVTRQQRRQLAQKRLWTASGHAAVGSRPPPDCRWLQLPLAREPRLLLLLTVSPARQHDTVTSSCGCSPQLCVTLYCRRSLSLSDAPPRHLTSPCSRCSLVVQAAASALRRTIILPNRAPQDCAMPTHGCLPLPCVSHCATAIVERTPSRMVVRAWLPGLRGDTVRHSRSSVEARLLSAAEISSLFCSMR